jgi:MFS family permease
MEHRVARAGRRTDYRITFVVLCVAVSSFSLLQSMVNPVLPTIQAALDTDQRTVTWLLTAYLVSASVFTPIIGRIGDKVGKERMLVVTMCALAIGSLIAALAPSIGVLIFARVVQGVGGGVLPLTFGIIRDEFPRERVAGAIGTAAALLAVGGGLGLVVAGPLVEALSYAWLVCLLLPVSQGSAWGWTSPGVLALLTAAAVLCAVWVRTEVRSADPLVDMRMMRLPAVWRTNLVAVLMGVGMYSFYAFLPQFLQTPASAGYGFAATVTDSGWLLLPQSAATFLAGLASGRLAARYGSKRVLVVGSSLNAIGLGVLTVAHDELWQVLGVTLVTGLAFGLAFAAMSNLVVEAVPSSQTGVASGMNANIRTIGGALGGAALASIVTAGVRADDVALESGYTNGFGFLAVIALLATVVAVFVPVLRREPSMSPDEVRHAEAAVVAPGALVSAARG